MKITVIVDHSIEGLEFKKALESNELEEKLRNEFTIRWGNWTDGIEAGVVFNSAKSIKNTIDKEVVLLTLKRNAVKCPRRIKPGKKSDFPIIGRQYEHNNGLDIKIIDSLEEYKRCEQDYFVEYLKIVEEYRVHVMDTDVFYIEEQQGESHKEKEEPIIRTEAYGYKRIQTDLSHKTKVEKKAILNLAKKAVYALGLDFGVVNIGKELEGEYFVLDADPVCVQMSQECKDAYSKQFTKMLLKYDSLMSTTEEITIGADPECVIQDKDSRALVFASDFFTKEGMFGLDNRSIEAGRKYFPIMELRPMYSIEPQEVFSSIQSILQQMLPYVHYQNIGLYGGSMPLNEYWVGGHIHFGMKPNSKLIRALDNYLALPLLMVEKTSTARKRKTKYGALGNYRMKSHGGFEYCTLSSWLVSPEIALAVLCLAKVISQEYLVLKEEFLCNYADSRAFYLVQKSYFKDKITKIVTNIRETNTFKKYSACIEPLFSQILSCQEWDEDRDMKEAWGFTSSSEIFQLTSRCFIPKSKREELHLEIGQSITVAIGAKQFDVHVFPKDDFSAEKNSYVGFSQDICREIGLQSKESLNLWFENENKIFRAGPVFGILCDVESDDIDIFGAQTYYFRKLIKFSKEKGMITYVFSLCETEWPNHRIKGYVYDFEKEEWVSQHFASPDVFYNRGGVLTEENYGAAALQFLEYVKENNKKFINSIECVDLTSDKWEMHQFMKNKDITNEMQPETYEYKSREQLQQFIDKHRNVYLKLKDGSRSKGIFYIEKQQEDMYIVIHKDLYDYKEKIKTGQRDLFEIIDDKIEEIGYTSTDYIMQKAIQLKLYKDRSFEIRVVMQKNSAGKWFRTCMIARCAGEKEKFIDVSEEINLKSSIVLSECFGEKWEAIEENMRKMSKDIVTALDEENIQAGELAIDFGVDQNANIFVIELNSRPDNLLYAIGAFKTRNLAIGRTLEYAKFLCTN